LDRLATRSFLRTTFAFGDSQDITATGERVSLFNAGNVQSLNAIAEERVFAFGDSISSFTGEVTGDSSSSLQLRAFQDIDSATITSFGSVNLFAGNSADFTISDESVVESLRVLAGGNVSVSGSATASDEISLISIGGNIALSEATSTATSTNGQISIVARGSVTGNYTANGDLSASSLSTAGISGDFTSEQGDLELFSIGDLSGSFEADAEATIASGANISGNTTSGSAVVAAGGSISGTVETSQDAEVLALGGGITGDVTSDEGSISATVSGQLSSNLVAGQNVALVAEEVSGAEIRAEGGEARVFSIGDFSNGLIFAEESLEVVALQSIQDTTITAGQTANVTVLNRSSGAIEGENVNVLTGQDLDSDVIAVASANVSSLGSVNGDISTSSGDIGLLVAGDLLGTVESANNLTVTVFGNSNAPEGISADGALSGVFHGELESTIDSGDQLRVFAYRDIQGDVTAGGDATVSTLQSVSGTIEGEGSVEVNALNTISGDIIGRNSVEVFATHGHQSDVTSLDGEATITTLGNFDGSVDAEMGLELRVVGSTGGDVTTLGNADILVSGDADFDFINADDLDLNVGGNLSGVVQSDGDTEIIVLGNINADFNSGGTLDLLAGGQVAGTFIVQEDLNVFAAGNLDVDIDAIGSASVFSTGSVNQSEIDSDGDLLIAASGGISQVVASASNEVTISTTGSISFVEATSRNSSVSAFANGSISTLTINANQNAIAAATSGSLVSSNLSAGGDAAAFGNGVDVVISAMDDATVGGTGSTNVEFTAGRDALVLSTGPLIVSGAAQGNLSINSRSSTIADVTSFGLDVFSFGSIFGDFTATGNITEVVTFDSVLGSLNAGNDIGEVLIYNDLVGQISANGVINRVALGGEIQPESSISANEIESFVENDRSEFVVFPGRPVLGLGTLFSLSQTAQAQLTQQQMRLLESEIALNAIVQAVLGNGRLIEAEISERADRSFQQIDAALANVKLSLAIAESNAEILFDRRIAIGSEILDAAKFGADLNLAGSEDELDRLTTILSDQLDFLRANAERNASELNMEADEFRRRTALRQEVRERETRILRETFSDTFILTYISELQRFSLDALQEVISQIGFAVDLVTTILGLASIGTGIGPFAAFFINIAPDTLNAGIDLARGRADAAGLRLGFAFIPAVGGRLGRLLKLDTLASRIARTGARRIFAVADAPTIRCACLQAIGRPGCFIAGTLVAVPGGALFVPDLDDAGMDAATLNWILAGLSVSAGLGALSASQRKKKVGAGRKGQAGPAFDLPGFRPERFVNEDGIWLPKRLSETLWLPDSKIVQPGLILLEGSNQ